MAKVEMGILGGFSGRVGTVVGYYRRGGWYVRAYQPHIRDRRSEAQLLQRGRFKAMIQFASQATSVLRVGMRKRARAAGLTEGNFFLRENHTRFSSGTSQTGSTSRAGDFGIEYAALRFSMGSLPGVRLREAAVDAGGRLRVCWESLGGVRGDRVHVYVYDAACGRGVAAVGRRGEGRVEVLLPDELAGGELHVWAFAEGRNGRVSPTAYVAAEQEGSQAPENLYLEISIPQFSKAFEMTTEGIKEKGARTDKSEPLGGSYLSKCTDTNNFYIRECKQQNWGQEAVGG